MTEAWVKPLGGETAHAARINSLKPFGSIITIMRIKYLVCRSGSRIALQKNEPNLLICLSRRQN
jgi:hypothetical protein